MKTRLNIHSIEQKTTATGKKFWSVKTNENGMACFDAKAGAQLEQNIGRDVDVEVVSKNNFKNITAFYAAHEDVQTQEREQSGERERWADNSRIKQASMIISYVKDLVVAKIVSSEDFKTVAVNLMKLHDELVHGEDAYDA